MGSKQIKETIRWYDLNAPKYADATSNLSSEIAIEQFVKLLKPKTLVLDAGCAAGRDTYLLTAKGLKVIGLDISKGLLKAARKKFPRLEFIYGDLLKLNFADNYFGGVWANSVLLHLENQEKVLKALKNFYRILSDKGIIHITVKAKKGKKKVDFVKDSLSKTGRFFQYFSLDEVKKLLEEVDFKIIIIEQYLETERYLKGRPGIEEIRVLAQKDLS